jgi:Lsr2
MAQKVQTLLTCDIHDDDTAGDGTIAFSLGGSAYEVDVCDDHAAEITDAFAPFIEAAHKPAANGARPGRRRVAATGNGSRASAIRAWANAQGLKVSERGRIAQSVEDQYQAVH